MNRREHHLPLVPSLRSPYLRSLGYREVKGKNELGILVCVCVEFEAIPRVLRVFYHIDILRQSAFQFIRVCMCVCVCTRARLSEWVFNIDNITFKEW